MSDSSFLLRNARVVLPDHVFEATNVLIESGRIARLSTGSLPLTSDSVREEDLQGFTLVPGFIDLHIHGAVGVDTMDAMAAQLHQVSQFLVAHGITSWLPTLVPAPTETYRTAINSIQDAMESAHRRQGDFQKAGARILGVHYEGPYVNNAQCGALRAAYFRSYSSPSDLEVLPAPESRDAIRMMTLAPEIEGGVELVKELDRKGWIISIGHTRADLSVLDRAFNAGARHLTHFMNAMPQLHHRSPGPVGWGLARDDVSCDIIADGIHLDPSVLQLVLKTKTSDRLTLISDSIAAAGKGDGEFEIWGETIVVKDGRTSNSRGSIAGSVITMLDAVRMMRSVGAGDTDVARMTASNPAKLLGLEHDLGSIEEGKRADLVALNDGAVKLVFVGGEIVYDAR